jgi:hypothetical protein
VALPTQASNQQFRRLVAFLDTEEVGGSNPPAPTQPYVRKRVISVVQRASRPCSRGVPPASVRPDAPTAPSCDSSGTLPRRRRRSAPDNEGRRCLPSIAPRSLRLHVTGSVARMERASRTMTRKNHPEMCRRCGVNYARARSAAAQFTAWHDAGAILQYMAPTKPN